MAVKDDEAEARFLPSTSYVVLGLLSFDTRLTGYEIRRWALGSTRFFWSAPAMSQVYRELSRLEEAGFVDRLDESGDAERARTTFGLTADGRREVTRWVNDAPFEPPVLRHPAAFRLFLGHLADRDRLIDLLEEQRRWVSELIADLEAVDADLADDARFGHAALVAAWGLRFFGGERRAVTELLDTLRTDDP